MKTWLAEIGLRTARRTEFVRIDDVLERSMKENGWSEGTLVVYCPHTTASLAVNEGHDAGLLEDFERSLERLAPWQAGYQHNEENAAAHVKALLLGSSVTLLVELGRLSLGRWQSVFFCEFDGPRARRLRLRFHPVTP